MSETRSREIIRQFPQNGMKLLLHNPENVRDLLQVARSPLVPAIDFDQMRVDPTDYVASDFRHVESDLVLTAPFRPGARKRRKTISLYVLLEHQSEPDRLMVLRVLDYLVQIWKAQVRAWGRRHGSLASVRLQPILPVVFYTGTYRWEAIGQLVDLIEEGSQFRDVTPFLTPLFVNLPDLSPLDLQARGGFFGDVLHLLRERDARRPEFRALLRQVVTHLETIPKEGRLRWLELLSYVSAFVYHYRNESERPQLNETIEASLRSDEHRQEVRDMGRTIAEAIRAEGDAQGTVRTLQQTLVRMLTLRYGELQGTTEQLIRDTIDFAQLNAWVDRFVTAKSLDEVMAAQPAPAPAPAKSTRSRRRS